VKYLLDTNIVSELQKTRCNPRVRDFIEAIPTEELYVSSITLGELSYGVEKLPPGKKKHDLTIWLYAKLTEWFQERVLPLDTDTLIEWGRIRAHAGRTMPAIDMLIAATAIAHHMTLVTRNVKDFEDVEGINLINPWEN
jgi:predicted nucleic acid-binding protein